MKGTSLPTPRDCSDWTRDWALFLDIDGTLLDLAPDPQGVCIPSGLPAQLGAIALGLGGALALISGRPLGDIDRFFPGEFDAAGTHGAQWRLDGTNLGPGPLIDAALEGIYASLEEKVKCQPGISLELKPHAIAIHYRQAPEREEEVWLLAREAGQALGPAFRTQAGKFVVEILPAGASKGSAIQKFMGLSPYAGRTPLFFGDDLTDEDGFKVVNRFGGYSVRVGPRAASKARFYMHSPAMVRDWLAGLEASLKARLR
jgi:trehalose 6-phosphate phosphatase